MKNLMAKGLVLSLALAFLGSFFLSIQLKAAPKASDKKININTASAEELQKLPQIGAKVAQRIVDFRKEHGKFKKIEEIMKVKGIGEKTFNKIKNMITVGQKAKNE